MLLEDVQLLRCIDCYGDLSYIRGKVKQHVIIHGILECDVCKNQYPVIDEVGVFFRKEVLADFLNEREMEIIRSLGLSQILHTTPSISNLGEKKQLAVSKNWEYQWTVAYPWKREDLEQNGYQGERLFWTFIPVTPQCVKNRVVFIACGGKGREAYHVSKQSPVKVIMNEIGAEIYEAKEINKEAKDKLLLLRGDITYHPLKPEIADVTICDHALQHVLDHRLAFSKLVESTKRNGKMAICVYSHENNFLMTRIIEPLKGFFHRFPLPVQRAIAFLPAAGIFLTIHLVYVPVSKLVLNVAKKLPLFEHMMFWNNDSFSFVWLACFDLIHAPIAYYFSKDEVVNLAQNNNLCIDKLINTHGTTWSLVGSKSQ